MLLLGIAGILASIAGAATVVTSSIPVFGKGLAAIVIAVGTVLGTTIATVVSSTGAAAITVISVGLIAGSSTLIAGNVVVRKVRNKLINPR